MAKLLIKGGRAIDPANRRDGRFDVLIDRGAIADVQPNIPANGAKTIDAAGKLVVPGFVDLHTHLREPGREDKETIETGARAAVRGGFTTVCGPPTLMPPQIEQLGVQVTYDIEAAIRDAEVLMLLRIQHERQESLLVPSLREYRLRYGIDRERLARAKPDVLIMHPGPVNRGVELDSAAADGSCSVILDQVTNGLAVRMAALYLVSGATKMDEEPV